MKFLDLVRMSVNNLRRRKMRTVLTVLGVIIGTASIVVMVSLGLGLQARTVEQYASYGSLTTVEIYSESYWSDQDSAVEPNYLTDEVIARFKQLKHVKGASPVLPVQAIMKQGGYQSYVSINGVSRDLLDDIPVGEGSIPDRRDKELKMVVGNMVASQFHNPKSRGDSWGEGSAPDIDFMNRPMFVIFDIDAYYQSQHSGGEGEQTVAPPKKYMIPTSAMVKGGPEDYSEFSHGVYVDIDALKEQLSKIFRKKPIPGQPTTKKGKALPYLVYESARVFVDDMEHVADVQKEILQMGFEAHSNMEWLDQARQQTNMMQTVLGGIGAVSLFVAAIGIANTMMMAIYERTKEIGVMKVLGCDMRMIRNMFLIESALIGFMGGVLGLGLSYSISWMINSFSGKGMSMMGMGMGAVGDLSVIPSWLSGLSIVFAILVGMTAGFLPATRAMKLSPLAAIRND